MDKRANAPPAAVFYTSTLPLLNQEQSLSLASGYLPARPPQQANGEPVDDAHLYFVLERARHMGAKRRLIIWLNGGPGCSSFDGMMMEVGAFRPDMRGGLEWTKPGGAWNEYADVLYLDQPVGTGFSYVNTNGYARTLDQAADEVVYFLDRLVEVYPEYAKGNGVDVYIAGESYAGQYIPFTAAAILRRERSAPIDLRGIVIGNGFIDPKAQGGSELEMMVKSKVWDESSTEYREVKAIVDTCRAEADKDTQHMRNIPACASILPSIIQRTKEQTGNRETCINIYDVRLSDTAPACGMNWPPTLKATYDYLARPDVRKALHVDQKHKPEAWVECNSRVGAGIESEQNGKASVIHLPYILEKNVPVLLFAGDQDLICNHIGVERVAEQLQWGGRGWGSPEKLDWFVNNAKAGYWRTERNLTYVSIAGASHMVGVDKPIEVHDMMLRFMGVDLMSAAGPSAQIPSRLQGEPDRVLVLAGGGTGEPGKATQDNRPMIPGVSGKTEEEVAEEAKWAAYYNAGSAALIVLLLLFGTGTCILLRLRRKTKSSRTGTFLPVDTEDGPADDAHEMDRFIDDRSRTQSTADLDGEDGETTYSDDTYRIDAATASNTLANGRRNTGYRDDDDDGKTDVNPSEQGRNGGANGGGFLQRDSEQIFDVGEQSDDEGDAGVTGTGRPRGTGNDAVRFAQ